MDSHNRRIFVGTHRGRITIIDIKTGFKVG